MARSSASDTYHGVVVDDPFQWLEDDGDLEVQAWAARQNRLAREQLDGLGDLESIRSEIRTILYREVPRYRAPRFVGDRVFALKLVPPAEQASLVVFADEPGSEERVVCDPTALDHSGLTQIDWFEPSPSGARVAISLSTGGSERGDVRVLEVATGAQIGEVVEHVTDGTAGGDLEWVDESSFYYTRYPRAGERPAADEMFYQQVWFHDLENNTDRCELGDELPRVAEIHLSFRRETRELLVTVQNGDGGEMAHHLRSEAGVFTQLSRFADGIKGIFFGPPGCLFALSRAGAPQGKLLALTGGETDLSKAVEIVAEDELPFAWAFWQADRVLVTADRIFAVYQAGGPTELRVFDHAGARLADPPQDPVGAIAGLQRGRGDEVVYFENTYKTPARLVRLGSDNSATVDERLSEIPLVDLSDVEVRREMATSKDGTRVPVNIMVPAGAAIDGAGACVVTGYGGYGLSLEPKMSPVVRIAMDRKVCFAVANLRGGGEFGTAWHEAGRLTRKQNVFDDFIAVIEHLVDRGYAARDRVGIVGASNGGLLMGAVLTQRPELPRAVVSIVGIYDALRTELEPNGEFNITEFGTVEDPEQFAALHAYSPYHRVRDGVDYPAILLTHGDNDPRVAPWHSRKMAARLQASGTSRPVLLRTSSRAGHGAASLSETVARLSHEWAFMLGELGVSRSSDPG